jgi:hypothetical protein
MLATSCIESGQEAQTLCVEGAMVSETSASLLRETLGKDQKPLCMSSCSVLPEMLARKVILVLVILSASLLTRKSRSSQGV